MPFPNINYHTYAGTHSSDNNLTRQTSGVSRVRPITGRSEDFVDVTLILTASELGLFRVFFVDEINNGADTFFGPYWVGGVEKTGTLQIIGGYNSTPLGGGNFQVSYSFRIVNRDLSSENSVYDAVIANGGFPLP